MQQLFRTKFRKGEFIWETPTTTTTARPASRCDGPSAEEMARWPPVTDVGSTPEGEEGYDMYDMESFSRWQEWRMIETSCGFMSSTEENRKGCVARGQRDWMRRCRDKQEVEERRERERETSLERWNHNQSVFAIL